MGWTNGSEIAEDLWRTFRQFVPEAKRPALAREIIERFEAEDCDTMDEATMLQEDAAKYEEAVHYVGSHSCTTCTNRLCEGCSLRVGTDDIKDGIRRSRE